MGGNTDMTMMTKEIEAEEMKSNAFVEKLTQQMDNLKVGLPTILSCTWYTKQILDFNLGCLVCSSYQ
jgi:hypothetical protein